MLYEVICNCPEKWQPDNESYEFKTMCCPDKWRLIMAGGRYNSATEAGYAPVEGELLGIASALHRKRYFISGHPRVQVITDHRPLVNFLTDLSRRIANKRLANLRRKCDKYVFKVGYGKGGKNLADCVSHIKDWKKIPDDGRLPEVSDNQYIDEETQDNIRKQMFSVTKLSDQQAN